MADGEHHGRASLMLAGAANLRISGESLLVHFGPFWAILGAAASERCIARVAGGEVGRAALKGCGGGKGVGNVAI